MTPAQTDPHSSAFRRRSLLIICVLSIACRGEAQWPEPPAGSYTAGSFQVEIDDAVSALPGATVTLDFFSQAKAQPLLGRFFADADRASPAVRVAVLSHDLWRGRFGSSPTIIGRTIEVDGGPSVVVGIAPRGFTFPGGSQLWLPANK